MKIYLNKNVYEAAVERFNFIFDEFDDIIVGHSGGKDSTVVFNMAMQVATERGRLPLKVLWLDQEAEWQSTEDLLKSVFERDDVEPYWLQVPFKVTVATNYKEDFFYCWDPDKPDIWMRPKSDISVKENIYGFDQYIARTFDKFLKYEFKGRKAALLGGVRVEESPGRSLGLTTAACYKGRTWGKVNTPGLHYSLYPLYDWSYTDIWKAINQFGWDYNKLYDAQYKLGIPVLEMRCSPQIHAAGLWNLFYAQEYEPETYDRLIKRQAGVHTVAQFGGESFFVKKLPFMFKDWREYRDYLIEKLIETEPAREVFRKRFAEHDEVFAINDKIYKSNSVEAAQKAHVNMILAHDGGEKADMMRASWDNRFKRKARREYLAREAAADVFGNREGSQIEI